MQIENDYEVISPAYGRDYKSKAAAEAGFRSGEDWRLESILLGGAYCSIRDFKPGVKVELRYKRLAMACIVEV